MEEDATLGRIGGFRLIRRLATGGTSDVLLARAEGPHGFERTVVLKRLLSEHQNDPDFARMFTREAAAYARLSHPAIVRLFDFFTASSPAGPGGQLVMVLEYVDGISLAKLMTHTAQSGQKLDDRVAFFLAARVFDALSAAHDAHNPDTGEPTPVIHRDVNPSNVLIPWEGHAKLADFGIAKIQGGDEAETSQGLIKGTYGYMAPEQVRGERVTIRTDVYAATLVLWELLARRKAIQADKLPEMEILRAMAEPNLPKLDILRPELHESIREAVTRGLEPNPAKRAMTAEEMMGILRAHFDPEDARQRLERVLSQIGGRRSLSDTIAEDLRETTEGQVMSLPSFEDKTDAMQSPAVAVTLPIPTEPRPKPAAPPATPRLAATMPLAMSASAAAPVLEVKRQTPSGFRAVGAQPNPAPPPQPAPPPPVLHVQPSAISKPTLAGGFAPMMAPPAPPTVPHPVGSDPATLETKRLSEAEAARLAPPPPMQMQMQMQPPPPQQIFQPPPQAAWTPPAPAFVQPTPLQPPVLPGPAPRRSLAAVIVVAALLGFVVVAALGATIFYLRARSVDEVAATTARPAATTPPTTPTATPTPRTTATSTATAKPTTTASTAPLASHSAAPTATATTAATTTSTPTATGASNLPTPGPNEGVLILPASAQGHRVFVDGRVKGDGSGPLVIACGSHTVQIGSAGKPRDVNVPCGALAKLE